MTRTMLIVSVALMFCHLSSRSGYASEPGHHPGVSAIVFEAEAAVKMKELELKIAELEVVEATFEVKKFKLHLGAVSEQGESREMEHLKLAIDQAATRVEMRRVQSEIVRLQLALAKAALEYEVAAQSKSPAEQSQVRLEYKDDSDVVVMRGKKSDVEKTKALLEDEIVRTRRPPSNLEIKIFSIANGNARDLTDALEDLFGEDPASPIYVACDPRTNSVIVRGPPKELAMVEAMMLRLDRE